jgi:hypothetical protein
MDQEDVQPLVPDFRYEAVYRARRTPEATRAKDIRVTPTSESQEAHDAEALRQAHAVVAYSPEQELVRVARATGGPGGGAEVVLDRDEELQAARSSRWLPHINSREADED